ncbi:MULTISPECIES: hypothetical protein [Deinococcus]|uniref:Uncharacterized protein n=1 Tax=Deinococcus geothermalis (strain DSM 11300 / CIP 105573 / AG-3a) TaxID=319795 RepID=Q1IYM4_DEIGD|nr:MULTISPECIES: hypothetical protein [Deinococcus]ABF45660.1 hypothetical protein Dgeo_1365 [Deinococcus geothermalis DSM 11300]TDE85972.1 hypothetical protein E0686_08995 [Deinococcus sp. S9]
MINDPSVPYPSVLLSPVCPDVAVSPLLLRDLLLHLRATAHVYTLAGDVLMADHVSSLAAELEKAVWAEQDKQYLDVEQRR